MKPRKITEDLYWVGAVDWDRRLFDELIPTPGGTSYNAYLLRGGDQTVLFDTVDPSMEELLLDALAGVERIDYIVAHHAEQDHSGAIPRVLEAHPQAQVVTTPRGATLLIDELHLPEDRFLTVEDHDTLSLGEKTLEFIHTPWVHWPETMVSYLCEDRLLFSCDFFGSHLATSALFADDEREVYPAARRYYAEIMMPFRKIIEKNLVKLESYDIDMILPSHGPIYRRPQFIMDTYRDWVLAPPGNIAVVAYISMHGSTQKMVGHLVEALIERDVLVKQINLAQPDVGELASALVDAGTIVIATPTVLTGAHPNAVYATYLANALRPKARFASVIGSYGWGGKTVDQIAGMLSNLEAEMLQPVITKGSPRQDDYRALDRLAETIARKPGEVGLV